MLFPSVSTFRIYPWLSIKLSKHTFLNTTMEACLALPTCLLLSAKSWKWGVVALQQNILGGFIAHNMARLTTRLTFSYVRLLATATALVSGKLEFSTETSENLKISGASFIPCHEQAPLQFSLCSQD